MESCNVNVLIIACSRSTHTQRSALSVIHSPRPTSLLLELLHSSNAKLFAELELKTDFFFCRCCWCSWLNLCIFYCDKIRVQYAWHSGIHWLWMDRHVLLYKWNGNFCRRKLFIYRFIMRKKICASKGEKLLKLSKWNWVCLSRVCLLCIDCVSKCVHCVAATTSCMKEKKRFVYSFASSMNRTTKYWLQVINGRWLRVIEHCPQRCNDNLKFPLILYPFNFKYWFQS